MKPTVIFDMDGVIIDSEPIHRGNTVAYFAELGVHLTQKELERFVGSSAKMNLTYIKETYGLSQSVDTFMDDLRAQYQSSLRSRSAVEPIEGTRALIESLHQADFQLILASSANRDNINLVLELTGLSNFFYHRVSGAELPESKPNPDIFLKAAGLGKVAPTACLVIEDSTHGVTAAKGAGMICIGHQNESEQDISHADLVVQHMTDISVSLIQSLMRPK